MINNNVNFKGKIQQVNNSLKVQKNKNDNMTPKAVESESYKKNSNISSNHYFANYALSFSGKAISINNSGKTELNKRADGGYLLKSDMGLVAYFNDDAKKYVKGRTEYSKDTQILNNKGGQVVIKVGDESFTFTEPGIIKIGRGTKAKVEVLKGDPQVITTEKSPDWYKSYGPDSNKFNSTIAQNKHYYFADVSKKIFKDGELDILLDNGIVKPTKDERFYRFEEITDFDKSDEFGLFNKMQSKLQSVGLSDKRVDSLLTEWSNSKEREISGRESGKFSKKQDLGDLTDKTINTLKDNGIVKQFMINNEKDEDTYHWANYQTQDELTAKLDEIPISGKDKEKVVELWQKTSKAGYDISGLIWEPDNGANVTVYASEKKLNLGAGIKSDWKDNSTMWAGNGREPFSTGLSSVDFESPTGEPCSFADVRTAEALHKHPDDDDANQAEIYYGLGDNVGAIATVINGKLDYTMLENDDLVLIEPGTIHEVAALGGEGHYIHNLIQGASVFHLPYKDNPNFKLDVDPVKETGLTNEQIIQGGIDAIKQSQSKKTQENNSL